MITLVFFLEENSAKILLDGLLPRFLPMDRVKLRFVVFEGKQDLERQLVRKMRGWRTPDTLFVVLRDQDSADCRDVKSHLLDLCQEADRPNTLVRVACHEIESWYLGDLAAVEQALGTVGVAKRQNTKKFRDSDRLENPSRVLAELTDNHYQKIRGSRAIGQHLKLDSTNRSESFRFFISGVQDLISTVLTKA